MTFRHLKQTKTASFFDFLLILFKSRCLSTISPTVRRAAAVGDGEDEASCRSLAAAAVNVMDESLADAASVCVFSEVTEPLKNKNKCRSELQYFKRSVGSTLTPKTTYSGTHSRVFNLF